MHNILSIDIEDWFHILDVDSSPAIDRWSEIPSRIEANTFTLLDLLDRHQVKATCFVVGKMAELHPSLVRTLHCEGHEVASHGYSHSLAYELGELEFSRDALRARLALEDIIGAPVEGYRASGFSVTPRTPWFFEQVAAAGYRYDSSIFPARHGHGGIPRSPLYPYQVQTRCGPLIEFPITVAQTMLSRFCFSGGGHLRFFPYSIIKQLSQRINDEGRSVIFYVHPREIDPTHPRLPMPLLRRLKTYINLTSTRPKLDRLMSDFTLTTFRNWLRLEMPSSPTISLPAIPL